MFKKTIFLQLIISLLVMMLAACAAPAQSGEAPAPPPARPPKSRDAESPPTIAAAIEPSPTAVPPVETLATETSTIADPSIIADPAAVTLSYSIVDTGQTACYDNNARVACPTEGQAFYGQDAQYQGNQPAYTDNGDGTVTDHVTGLMWQQSPDTNGDGAITAADKLTYDEAVAGASRLNLAGYTDWRLPTIKELYSLIDFSGVDSSGPNGGNTSNLSPFIETDYFDFAYGDAAAGERLIDAQFASVTKYVSTTMNGSETMFGVNFADGRIKGYPTGAMPGQSEGKGFFVLYVRGNPDYGINHLTDNGDGTITDSATGLMWAQNDSGAGLNWEEALAWVAAQNAANYLGYSDWRLPNAKEMQSLVDYSRSPDATGGAAIDPLFNVAAVANEAGQTDYPAYWSSTTHVNMRNGAHAVYIAFGRAMGYMHGAWIDVHGAGAQRSDPKSGDAAAYPTGHGPQGDAIRIDNYVRLARGGDSVLTPAGDSTADYVGPPVGTTTNSEPPGPGAHPGPNGRPPQVAISACEGLTAGAACQFTAPHGAVTGTCDLIQEQLACVPQGGPPGGEQTGGPPPRGQ